MQYLLLIVGPEPDLTHVPENAHREMMKEWFDYTQALVKAGVLKGGDALEPMAKASRISIKDGKRTVLDGPFAESKEVVGGYYLIETKTRAEAVDWAAKCPGARFGTIELREVTVFAK